VNVKARNGGGLWSTIGSSSRLVIDTSPPSTPTRRFTYSMPGGNPGQPQPPPTVVPPIPLPPELIPPISPPGPYFQAYYPGAPASITPTWNAATDSESGIYAYKYRLMSASDTSQQADDWTMVEDSLQVTLSGGLLSYDDSFYVKVAAINYAGLESDQLRIGPLHPVDPSPPSQPVAALSYGLPAGTNYLIFSNRSHDYETGVDHYEVAVGSLPGNPNLIPWTDAIQFSPDDIGTANAWVMPNLGLAQGTTAYIHLRAVNSKGMNSTICVTGPFVMDNTPPVRPLVAPEIRQQGHISVLHLTFYNLIDNESGIQRIEYAVGTSRATTDVIDWRSNDLVNELDISYILLGWARPRTYYIKVRTVNGVNMTSLVFQTSIYIP
jgi:hypothetical protein